FKTTDASVAYGQTRTGNLFDEIPDEFAAFDGVQKRGHCVELKSACADSGEVIGQTADFAHQRADPVAALGNLDSEQLFNCQRVAEVVQQRADVVEAVCIRKHLCPGCCLTF